MPNIGIVASRSIVQGEPIFVGLEIRNPSGRNQMVDLRQDLRAGLALKMSGLKNCPLMPVKPADPKLIAEPVPTRFIPIAAEGSVRELYALDIDTSKLSPGMHTLQARASAFVSGQKISAFQRFEVTVRQHDPLALRTASFRIGFAIIGAARETPYISEGVPTEFGSPAPLIQAWTKMPVKPSLEGWRTFLLMTQFPDKAYAATLFAKRQNPEISHMIRDLLQSMQSSPEDIGLQPAARATAFYAVDLAAVKSVVQRLGVDKGALPKGFDGTTQVPSFGFGRGYP